jgi:hypothetical protein
VHTPLDDVHAAFYVHHVERGVDAPADALVYEQMMHSAVKEDALRGAASAAAGNTSGGTSGAEYGARVREVAGSGVFAFLREANRHMRMIASIMICLFLRFLSVYNEDTTADGAWYVSVLLAVLWCALKAAGLGIAVGGAGAMGQTLGKYVVGMLPPSYRAFIQQRGKVATTLKCLIRFFAPVVMQSLIALVFPVSILLVPVAPVITPLLLQAIDQLIGSEYMGPWCSPFDLAGHAFRAAGAALTLAGVPVDFGFSLNTLGDLCGFLSGSGSGPSQISAQKLVELVGKEGGLEQAYLLVKNTFAAGAATAAALGVGVPSWPSWLKGGVSGYAAQWAMLAVIASLATYVQVADAPATVSPNAPRDGTEENNRLSRFLRRWAELGVVHFVPAGAASAVMSCDIKGPVLEASAAALTEAAAKQRAESDAAQKAVLLQGGVVDSQVAASLSGIGRTLHANAQTQTADSKTLLFKAAIESARASPLHKATHTIDTDVPEEAGVAAQKLLALDSAITAAGRKMSIAKMRELSSQYEVATKIMAPEFLWRLGIYDPKTIADSIAIPPEDLRKLHTELQLSPADVPGFEKLRLEAFHRASETLARYANTADADKADYKLDGTQFTLAHVSLHTADGRSVLNADTYKAALAVVPNDARILGWMGIREPKRGTGWAMKATTKPPTQIVVEDGKAKAPEGGVHKGPNPTKIDGVEADLALTQVVAPDPVAEGVAPTQRIVTTYKYIPDARMVGMKPTEVINEPITNADGSKKPPTSTPPTPKDVAPGKDPDRAHRFALHDVLLGPDGNHYTVVDVNAPAHKYTVKGPDGAVKWLSGTPIKGSDGNVLKSKSGHDLEKYDSDQYMLLSRPKLIWVGETESQIQLGAEDPLRGLLETYNQKLEALEEADTPEMRAGDRFEELKKANQGEDPAFAHALKVVYDASTNLSELLTAKRANALKAAHKARKALLGRLKTMPASGGTVGTAVSKEVIAALQRDLFFDPVSIEIDDFGVATLSTTRTADSANSRIEAVTKAKTELEAARTNDPAYAMSILKDSLKKGDAAVLFADAASASASKEADEAQTKGISADGQQALNADRDAKKSLADAAKTNRDKLMTLLANKKTEILNIQNSDGDALRTLGVARLRATDEFLSSVHSIIEAKIAAPSIAKSHYDATKELIGLYNTAKKERGLEVEAVPEDTGPVDSFLRSTLQPETKRDFDSDRSLLGFDFGTIAGSVPKSVGFYEYSVPPSSGENNANAAGIKNSLTGGPSLGDQFAEYERLKTVAAETARVARESQETAGKAEGSLQTSLGGAQREALNRGTAEAAKVRPAPHAPLEQRVPPRVLVIGAYKGKETARGVVAVHGLGAVASVSASQGGQVGLQGSMGPAFWRGIRDAVADAYAPLELDGDGLACVVFADADAAPDVGARYACEMLGEQGVSVVPYATHCTSTPPDAELHALGAFAAGGKAYVLSSRTRGRKVKYAHYTDAARRVDRYTPSARLVAAVTGSGGKYTWGSTLDVVIDGIAAKGV